MYNSSFKIYKLKRNKTNFKRNIQEEKGTIIFWKDSIY